MFSRLSNGAASPANWARKIAGPFIVFMRADSRNSTEHLIMFSPGVHKFPRRWLVLVSRRAAEKTFRHRFVGGDYGSQFALRPHTSAIGMVAGKDVAWGGP